MSDPASVLCCLQVDKLEEAESERKTEEEVTEPQAMVFGMYAGSKSPQKTDDCEKMACIKNCINYLSVILSCEIDNGCLFLSSTLTES